MMSVFALIAFGFASKAIAAVDAYLWFKASDGKVTKVKINHDGTFQTPPLPAGTYSVSWGVGHSITPSTGGSTGRSMSSGGDQPTESISLAFQKIEWTYQVQAPPDPSSGAMTGRRRHEPITITKEIDKASPKLMTALGKIVIEHEGLTVSGRVMGMSKNGNKSAADAWDSK